MFSCFSDALASFYGWLSAFGLLAEELPANQKNLEKTKNQKKDMRIIFGLRRFLVFGFLKVFLLFWLSQCFFGFSGKYVYNIYIYMRNNVYHVYVYMRRTLGSPPPTGWGFFLKGGCSPTITALPLVRIRLE